ncbi:MAG: 3-hydroxy-3-methylglutaryl-coenzyme A (HMG-CoA) reductase isozyme [Vezdaea aestivalis]|nr:MAG: 3-hydroxy-3-methylglutaryl-coenzyme A (HMG-CoA) reductase isozyme [Vezdaea aestivalis]
MLSLSTMLDRFLSTSEKPSWLNRQVTPLFQSLSRRATTHPIHTIVTVALLASTSYVGLLEGSVFDSPSAAPALGEKQLQVGEQTGWKWQSGSEGSNHENHYGLVTLVFPDSSSDHSPQRAPTSNSVPMPPNVTATSLPSTANPLSSYSQDSTLAFSVPYDQVPFFLGYVQEIPYGSTKSSVGADEEKRWIMQSARGNTGASGGLVQWTRNAWTDFVDLVKNAETLDIIIMVLGYISMHLTFVSIFVSMKRLGSNFWLAATVLFSSVFAFLFGLVVTIKLGVPLNMVLLSEGLPFLVVTVGFEKPIVLTKAVLAAAVESRQQGNDGSATPRSDNSPFTIQHAVQQAVQEKGYEIVRDYAIEIVILIAGAASGVQGGLRQFCALAAWILVFDCILLFTFYTSILSVKLEINRIKRHVTLRKALEEDGVSHRVAENVAESNSWPNFNKPLSKPIFGNKVRDSSVPKFKVLMVSGFVLINIVNLVTIPFRGSGKSTVSPNLAGLSSVISPPPLDPFKVAGSGLDTIFDSAMAQQKDTVITIFSPIKYELEFPSVHYSPSPPRVSSNAGSSIFDLEYTDQLFDAVGGKVVEGVLKSLEDPILSKWILIALALSLVLNGYLFNAARWSVKEPDVLGAADIAPDVQGTESVPARLEPEVIQAVVVRPETKNVEEVQVSQESNRSRAQCELMVKEKRARELTDRELVEMSLRGKIPGYALEKTLADPTRAVKIRRSVVARDPKTGIRTGGLDRSLLPFENYDFARVLGACCENVIGYMPLPVGVAGPLTIDDQEYFIPMATTEGVLVASTSRGAKAINAGGGAVTVLTGDGMTRGPCVSFANLHRAGAAKIWLDSEPGQQAMKKAFNSTSRFARLQSLKTALAGTYLYIRFKTTTGDAMGMNMISKGVEHALHVMATEEGFEDMAIVSVSGNFCTDKKPAAINWVDGRGKSVVAEAIIPGEVVRGVLKSDVNALVELNTSKNLIGSAMAGSVGGFNAHAANVVTAIFLATGQDPAQNVESSNCITIMKNVNGNLQVSVSMPSIEVGTIGGGTILEPQGAMLDLLGVRGAHQSAPGSNARQLARIVAASVLAGELSLCSALAAGHLVKSHMAHNRSAPPTRTSTPIAGGSSNGGSVGSGLSSLGNGVQTPVGLAMTGVKPVSLGQRLKR